MYCKPCRLTYNGARYQIERNGMVRPVRIAEEPVLNSQGLPTGDTLRTRVFDAWVSQDLAKQVRAEAIRQRRNRSARERRQR